MHLQEFWELWVSFRCWYTATKQDKLGRGVTQPQVIKLDQFTLLMLLLSLLMVFIKLNNFFSFLQMVLFPLPYYVSEGQIGESFGPNKNTVWIGKGLKILLAGPERGGSLASRFIWCRRESLTPPPSQAQAFLRPSQACLFYSSRTEPAAV